VPSGQYGGSLRPCSRISRPETLLFLSSSSAIALTRLSGPLSLLRKSGTAANRTRIFRSVARNSDHQTTDAVTDNNNNDNNNSNAVLAPIQGEIFFSYTAP
jgi:hypothetical protein